MKIHLKYMTTLCCKLVVVSELKKLGAQILQFNGNEVIIKADLSMAQAAIFRVVLLKNGMDTLDDENEVLTEKIKILIIDKIHASEGKTAKIVFSKFLAKKLNMSYSYFAHIFSITANCTIEHFIITHKIEKVKEQLIYNQLNITEISYMFNYSSVSHLSNQFKVITGMTPTAFKNLKNKNRKYFFKKRNALPFQVVEMYEKTSEDRGCLL